MLEQMLCRCQSCQLCLQYGAEEEPTLSPGPLFPSLPPSTILSSPASFSGADLGADAAVSWDGGEESEAVGITAPA